MMRAYSVFLLLPFSGRMLHLASGFLPSPAHPSNGSRRDAEMAYLVGEVDACRVFFISDLDAEKELLAGSLDSQRGCLVCVVITEVVYLPQM